MAASDVNALVVSGSRRIKEVRMILERNEHYDASRKIAKVSVNSYALPITQFATRELVTSHALPLHEQFGVECTLARADLPKSRKCSAKTELQCIISRQLAEKGFTEEERDQLLSEIPKSWECHGDMVVMPQGSFTSPAWQRLGGELWESISKVMKCKRLAVDGRVACDGFRTSSATLVLGTDGWVEHVDNGIKYVFDVTKCMFASGNITEKIRVANLDCSGETVVDLYAGVGYFTLPYLVHARAKLVHACEWNPHAVEALRKGLVTNRVEGRCVVHFGDNRKVAPKRVADRVNLGLLPSSEAGWPVACAALNPDTGGWLHVHGNVCSKPGTPVLDSSEGKRGPKSQDFVANEKMLKPETEGGRKHEEGPLSLNVCTSQQATPDRQKSSPTRQSENEQLSKNEIWKEWSMHVAGRIGELLASVNPQTVGKQWSVNIGHVEHVKSYAPHVDHLVVDIECRPQC